jgi:hypothetical protein
MNRLLLIAASAALAACTSPESTRVRGGGPGADTGNRGAVVLLHEGAQPFWHTPSLIPVAPPDLDGALQAHRLSRD